MLFPLKRNGQEVQGSDVSVYKRSNRSSSQTSVLWHLWGQKPGSGSAEGDEEFPG